MDQTRCYLSVVPALGGRFLLLLLLGGSAAADDQRITDLVEQLSHEQWEMRQQAEDELVKFREEAVPALQWLIDQAAGEEAYIRAQSALARIEQELLTGPSIIRLDFEQAHPREVFEELTRQARTTLNLQPTGLWENREWDPITIRIDRLPFWEALDQVSEAAGLYPVLGGNTPGLTIGQSRTGRLGATLDSGAFRVAVTRIHRSATVDLSQDDRINRDLQLHLAIMPEPKLRVLQFGGLQAEEVVDEQGRSLLQQANVRLQGRSWATARVSRWNSVLRLNAEPEGGERIARFAGSAQFVIQTRAARLELPEALTLGGTTHMLAATPITIQQVRENNNQIEVQASTPREALRGADMQVFFQQLGNSAEMFDSQNRPMNRSGGRTSTTPQEMQFRWQFNRQLPQGGTAEPPFLLVLEVPADSREITVPFEFTDLPLP